MMSLTAGTRVGPYEVLGPLGAGGMGEVYRARDTKLDRSVALKILPDAFAADTDRLARFEREARTLASLNHPHIAQVHGLEDSASTGPGRSGLRALVMELVEGEDLSQRIGRGPVPLADALAIARQIAEALEAAHEQGIVHRDLKPANVKVRPDGTVKVLDFGLAKALDTQSAAHQSDQSPTLASPAMTLHGVILGTAGYMSPEQAAGRNVDKRSDLWAFGVVLLEMLTGRPVFAGETVSHVIASVLKSEPDWTTLPSDTPPPIRRLLHRCLEKDRKRRLDSAADARLEIEEALAAPHETASPAMPARAPASRWSTAIPWGLLALVSIAALAGMTHSLTRPAAAPPLVSRALIDFPQYAMSGARLGNLLAISSDGTRLVYVGNPDGKNRLYQRRLDQFEATPLQGTEGGSHPFISPDGNWAGYFSGGKLKKVSLAGGSPVTLADAPNPQGGSWGTDDTIVFGPDFKGLMSVPAGGGEPRRLTQLHEGDVYHSSPVILPGGTLALFTNAASPLLPAIDAVSIATGTVTRVVELGCCAAYAATGHLIYAHPTSGAVFAAPFDIERQRVDGKPVQVLEGVMAGALNGRQFGVSDNGSLVFLPNRSVNERSLVWVDRTGRATATEFEHRTYGLPGLSPDGRRVATGVYEGLNPKEVWVGDLERGTISRLASDGPLNAGPIWTPDGSRITFASRQESAVQNLYWMRADGSGPIERLTTSDLNQVPLDWSPDGKTLVYYETVSASATDLWTLTLDGDRTPKRLLATPFSELSARFSPDGRYLAYISDRSGRLEVYVQPFPGPGEVRQISIDGGTEPVWARNGRELFFRQGEKMMVVDVATSPAFSASRPRVLFEGRYEVSFLVPGARFYDVSPDGQRFLMVKSEATDAPRQLHLIVNWFEELKRLVPPR
jgi:serine/threonine-protein kinase